MKVKVAAWVFESGEWEVAAWADEDAARDDLPDEDRAKQNARDGGQLRVVEVEVAPWSSQERAVVQVADPLFLCGPGGCEVVDLAPPPLRVLTGEPEGAEHPGPADLSPPVQR